MKLLLVVIDDLYRFAVELIVRLLGGNRELTPALFTYSKGIPEGSTTVTLSPGKSSAKDLTPDVSSGSFRTVESVLKGTERPRIPDVIMMGPAQNTVMYANRTGLPVFKNPTGEFDTVVGRLSFGMLVMVLGEKGKFVRISSNGIEGWARREDLVDRAAHVYPEFIIGKENNSNDENTTRVRAILGDEFGGSDIEYPLQAGEYVLYRLYRKGLRIIWPVSRPRTPGMWHELLRGMPGTHMGVAPKTGTIMEYMLHDELGHVAYVEAVFPNETISISEVNFPHSGIYNERVLTREEWRELRPIFIQVTNPQ